MAQIEAWNLRDAWLLLLLQVQQVTHLPPQLTLVAEGAERVLAVRSHGQSRAARSQLGGRWGG